MKLAIVSKLRATICPLGVPSCLTQTTQALAKLPVFLIQRVQHLNGMKKMQSADISLAQLKVIMLRELVVNAP